MIYRIQFDTKYGENTVMLPISGKPFTFNVRYGENHIVLPIGDGIDVTFEAKYGTTVIEFTTDKPVTFGLGNLFNRTCTIYNDIPASDNVPRRWQRTTVTRCNVQGQNTTRTSGTIINLVNQKTVITKDIERYRSPLDFYRLVDSSGFFTAKQGDFIVFDEVDDEVTTPAEWAALQNRYAQNGIKIQTVSEYLYGRNTDNVTMTD